MYYIGTVFTNVQKKSDASIASLNKGISDTVKIEFMLKTHFIFSLVRLTRQKPVRCGTCHI